VVLRNVLYVLPDDIFGTKSVPVKLVVQIFVLFVVTAGERGAEGSYFVPKALNKSTELCITDVQFRVKSLWVWLNTLTLYVKWTYSFRQPHCWQKCHVF